MLTITINAGTVHFYLNGEHVADSMTMRRARGFWNARTQQYVSAPELTPRKIRAQPARALAYFDMTGTNLDGIDIEVA